MQEHMEDFTEPWCKEIIDSPDYEPITSSSREYPPSRTGRTSNSLVSETLATDTAIRAMIFFSKLSAPNEVIMLVSMGNGVDGHHHTAHGGMVALLLDENAGKACHTTRESRSIDTANLNISFRAPVVTPCILFSRAAVEKEEGRKIWITSTLEDGKGKVFAYGEYLFIKRRPRPKM